MRRFNATGEYVAERVQVDGKRFFYNMVQM